jgi:hypothetical protein
MKSVFKIIRNIKVKEYRKLILVVNIESFAVEENWSHHYANTPYRESVLREGELNLQA